MRRLVLSIIATVMTVSMLLGPATFAATPPTYVAMGDSVAAGAGLPGSAGTLCDRSLQAYPYKIAARLGTTVTNLACSGAKVDEGIYGEQERGGVEIAPQLDVAFAGGVPDIITMTIGANDIRWTGFLRKCQVSTCGTTVDDLSTQVLRGDLRVELYWALAQIEQRSAGDPPQVLLNGYYNPISMTACSDTQETTVAERRWIRSQTTRLNQAILSVARQFSFAEYVRINMAGHEVCSRHPWIQGVRLPAPFHPYETAQDAIAEANLRVLNR